jgi:hypothetical protein
MGYHCSALILAQNEHSRAKLQWAFALQAAFADINIAKG